MTANEEFLVMVLFLVLIILLLPAFMIAKFINPEAYRRWDENIFPNL
jgi:hypothetical protein